jgi:hypothetical protein
LYFGVSDLWITAVRHDLMGARLTTAEGAIAGLGLKTIAALLKTIELRSWQQIAVFVVIFSLRTRLKSLFDWERRRIQADRSG